MEKVGGRWLIAYSNFATLRYAKLNRWLIQVAKDGSVIWASDDTLESLAKFEGLTISQNRLRATWPEHDKGLQATIAKIAQHVHLFASDLSAGPGSKPIAPCFLGEGQAGEVLSCLVFARNGEINVAFGEHQLARKRVELAAEYFGLSGAQERVVLALTSGSTITKGASGLGISVNTFRTHLARVYEKTGARSKTDLVRMMLSVVDAER